MFESGAKTLAHDSNLARRKHGQHEAMRQHASDDQANFALRCKAPGPGSWQLAQHPLLHAINLHTAIDIIIIYFQSDPHKIFFCTKNSFWYKFKFVPKTIFGTKKYFVWVTLKINDNDINRGMQIDGM